MKKSQLLRLIVLVGTLMLGHTAFATPVRCSPGFEDNTCLTPIAAEPEVAPTCPSTPGYTTAAPAEWMGSGYTAPTCSYTAAPSCPAGYNESSAPSWNGSSWVGLGCLPNAVVECAPGFSCDGSGTPYALLIGYCGEVSQTTILKVVRYTDRCTASMAGAVRVNQSGTLINGNGTLNYWNTSGSFATTSTTTYRNAAGPAGSIVQTVNIAFGNIQYSPNDTGFGTLQNEGAAGGGSDEGWVFACPATYPTINFSTVAAYGETNPTLIQCQ